MLKTVIIAAALGMAPIAAYAEETVVEHHEETTTAPPASVTVHEHDSTDCSQKTVHKENSEGDSKTVSKTNC